MLLNIQVHDRLNIQVHDRLKLKKPHPCGSYEWVVYRIGADIGLECVTCKRRVLLDRRELAKRLKANLTPREPNKNEGE